MGAGLERSGGARVTGTRAGCRRASPAAEPWPRPRRQAARATHVAPRPARRPPRSYNPPSMIDRQQVLHVAKLARLKLTDDEVERMSGELSTILDHIETIGELALEDVAPTTHVVELENVLRDDVPRPCLPRQKALEQAPDATEDGFRVPSRGTHG